MDVERGPDDRGSLWARPQTGPAPEDPYEDTAGVWRAPEPAGPTQRAAAAEFVDAGWWYRLLAFCVDVGAAIVIGGVILLPLILLVGSAGAAVGAALVALVAGWVIVTSVVSAMTGGQSVGKWIGAMRVVGDDGRPATFRSSVLRDLVFRVPYVLPLYAIVDGLFAAGVERRALHDRMAKTRVVRLPGYERRLVPLLAAVVVAAVAWGAVTALGRARDNGYTRSGFVHDCTGGAYDSARCGCIYDALVRQLGRHDLDQLESLGPTELRPFIQAAAPLDNC